MVPPDEPITPRVLGILRARLFGLRTDPLAPTPLTLAHLDALLEAIQRPCVSGFYHVNEPCGHDAGPVGPLP